MTGKQFREALHAGKKLYGTHMTCLNNFSAIKIMIDGGLDFAFICGEHMVLDSQQINHLCLFYRANGVVPIVRISSPDPTEATRALDLGAQGIVAPYVEEVAEVRKLVGAVRYRPLKGKQLQPILAGEPLSGEYREFFERFNADNFLIVGIESQTAYERFDALTDVPGVDGIFLGPHDISVSVGYPEAWMRSEYLDLMKHCVVRARAKNLGAGVHLPTKLREVIRGRELVEMGMNWILDGADATWAAQCFAERRAEFGVGEYRKDIPADATRIASCSTVDFPGK